MVGFTSETVIVSKPLSNGHKTKRPVRMPLKRKGKNERGFFLPVINCETNTIKPMPGALIRNASCQVEYPVYPGVS